MPQLGNFFILGAAAASLGSLIFYLLAWRGKRNLLSPGRKFFRLATGFIGLSVATLLYLILTHDFRVAYVFSYSSTDLPLGYLISTLWAGQEGTFLLWILYVGLMGMVMMRTAGSFEKGNMVFTNLFILSILLVVIKKSPFELLDVVRTEGAGLNPLLQNFWMQIHPPIMFVGFAGALFPFVFAVTALVERKYHLWAESARRWTLFAWAALGTSLVMGGYWAYITLGWGGFWAWDPVENSSFIPWVFLTTQVHSLFIKRQHQGMLRFSMFAVCLSFWSVLYGTFLTRSGVLADFSVHSFVDLGINRFLISGLIFFIALGGFMLALRWQDIKPNPSFSKVSSRSYLVALGIVVLFLGGVMTLLGTSAPLLTRVTDNPSAVGLSYYFATMTPVAIGVLILIGLFPAFRWNNGVSKPNLLIAGGSSAVVTIAFLLISGITSQIIYLLLFASAALALVTNSSVLYASWREGRFQPGYLAHVGLAIAIVGAASSAGFETKQTITLPQDEPIEAMGYDMRFAGTVDKPGGFDCHVEFEAEGRRFVAVLPHEFPKNAEGVMKKPHVEKFLALDVYVAPVAFEQPQEDDRSLLALEKGQTKEYGKYSVTFHDFEMGGHGDDGQVRAAALLTVRYDERSDDIGPSLTVDADSVITFPASFDYDRGRVEIAGVQPDIGGVVLKFTGDFVPRQDPAKASLVIELSRKPLINLFWLGTTLCFVSGALSMRERRRRNKQARTEEIDIARSKKEVAS